MSSPDMIAALELVAEAMKVAANTPLEQCSCEAYAQAVLAQASVQALIDLLIQQNIIGDTALQRHLARRYDERRKSFSDSGLLVPPAAAAPMVRRNG